MKRPLSALAAASAVAALVAATVPAANAAQVQPLRKNIAVKSAHLSVNLMPQVCDKVPCSEQRNDVLSITLATGKTGCWTDVRVRQSRAGGTLTVRVTGTPTAQPCTRGVKARVTVAKGVTAVVDGSTGRAVEFTTSITH